MSAWLLPLGATAAASLVTYVSCVRPMRRGTMRHPDMAPSSAGNNAPRRSAAAPGGDGEEIRRLAEEVQLLRRELELRESAGSTP